jgi:hypothetical protein
MSPALQTLVALAYAWRRSLEAFRALAEQRR